MTASDPTTADRTQSDPTRTVQIPEQTASAVSKRLWMTEFESVDGYVAFALDQLLREMDRRDDADTGPIDGDPSEATVADAEVDEDGTTGATDEAVAARLESLGYL